MEKRPDLYCNSELKKTNCTRAQETHIDSGLNETVTMVKQVPVLINYSVGKKRFEKTPDDYDIALELQGVTMPSVPMGKTLRSLPQ